MDQHDFFPPSQSENDELFLRQSKAELAAGNQWQREMSLEIERLESDLRNPEERDERANAVVRLVVNNSSGSAHI